MIRRILFPVDFSAACAAMAAYVQRAAGLWGATVSLVHVCDLTSHSGFELYARPGSEIAEEQWNVAKDKLDRFLVPEFPRESSPRILSAGDAASLIAKTAKENQFDLIVMPTHAGRFRRMLLGSTTAKVLDDAECPVLTMQHAESVAPRSPEHRTWVCAIGLASDSVRVLRLAQSAAAEIGAGTSVLHVIAEEGGESESDRKSAKQSESARKRLAELAAAASYGGNVRIVAGPVKETLLSAAKESQADVLVIGRSAPSGFVGRMRDLTYALIRDSVCPVVSV
jgi:nucleotide-binding universal stress UspA family protein